MQGLTLALALTGASALVAPAAPRAATALKAADEVFDYSSIAGGESGLGGRYDFDPMNFAGRYPGMVPWFREAELKHGRMCMLVRRAACACLRPARPLPKLTNLSPPAAAEKCFTNLPSSDDMFSVCTPPALGGTDDCERVGTLVRVRLSLAVSCMTIACAPDAVVAPF